MAAKKKTKKGETASDRWQAASKKWRNHVLVVPMAGGKRRLHLTGVRWRFEFKDGEEQTGIARDIQTDPDPSARDLLDLHHLAGEFEAVGLQLADAAAGIASDLVSTDALNLAKIMRRAPRRPTLAQFDLVEQVDLQVEHLAVRRGRPARLLTPMQLQVLLALPPSTGRAVKTQTIIADRIGKKIDKPDKGTVSKAVTKLRKLGFVDKNLLQRTAAGDRFAQKAES